MSTFAPRWAFTAQAIDGTGDTHLAKGIHLRVVPSPKLGLPVAPFLLYRHNLGKNANNKELRTDITWLNEQGLPVVQPFTVKEGETRIGILPPPSSGVCCWIEIDAAGSDLQIEAIVATPRADAVVATTTSAPFQLAASRIERLIVRGNGTIRGVRWLDAKSLAISSRPSAVLALPIHAGARYAALSNGVELANDRVSMGAPHRVGLHDQPNANFPSEASVATPDEEAIRVFALTSEVERWLEVLVNDLSDLPHRLRQIDDVFDELDKRIGKTTLNYLNALLSASMDPGVARWLGLMDIEPSPTGSAGDVIATIVRGFWHYDPDHLGPLATTIPASAILRQVSDLEAILASSEVRKIPPTLSAPFVELSVVACATLGNPSALPTPPTLGTLRNGAWMPLPPPQAEREVTIPLAGMVNGAVVALARRDNGAYIGLNSRSEVDRALPLLLSVPNEATSAGTGEFTDRTVPPPAQTFRVAQSDWFGRWSEWTEAEADAGIRPAPPRPALNVLYQQPSIPNPNASEPLAGTLQFRIPVPTPDTLPPGGHPLHSVRVSVQDGSSISTSSFAVGTGVELNVIRPAPPIERAGNRTITVTAQWQDSEGGLSVASEPISLTLTDPRPPASITLPNTLRFTALPDGTGKARVELGWGATASQAAFRVFYTDETRLMTRMERMVANNEPNKVRATQILNAVAAASTLDERANRFVENADFFTRDLFEPLTEVPLQRPSGAGTVPMKYQHALSGSLKILSFYRIVTASGSNVETNFANAPFMPIAVPNVPTPPQPLLTVQPLINLAADIPYQARLTVKIPRGGARAIEYRLRRSTTGAGDILQMPIAGSGAVPAPTGDEGQTFEIIDEGALDFAPTTRLKAWQPYQWVVEVRGAGRTPNEPPGRWSTPSLPTTTTLLPPTAPLSASALTAVIVGSGVEVRWEHPDPLLGGGMGTYRLDLYRRRPGEAERLLTSLSAEASPANGGRNLDRTGTFHVVDNAEPVPSGTHYRVIVVDPLGRASVPSAIVTV